jgi:hypothetical protein
MGFALLLRHRRPVELTEVAEVTGLGAEAAGKAVAKLAGAGWLDLDDSGRVAGAAGLSLATGPHGLTLGDTPFRTWCAYDALGIAAALKADARVGDDLRSLSNTDQPRDPRRDARAKWSRAAVAGGGWRGSARILLHPDGAPVR